MRSRYPLVLVLMMVTACPDGVLAQEGGGKATPKSHLIQDTDWYPTAEKRAEIVEDNVPAFRDAGDLMMTLQAEAKGVPLDPRWAQAIVVVRLVRGTPVFVVEAPRIVSYGSSNHSMIRAALNGRPERWDYPLTVRVLDGPSKDQIFVVPRDSVGMMKSVPIPVPPKPKAKPRPVDSATRADTMLRSARNLEAAGKGSGAMRLYRDVANSFPGTLQASEAESRIRALSGLEKRSSALIRRCVESEPSSRSEEGLLQ